MTMDQDASAQMTRSKPEAGDWRARVIGTAGLGGV